MHNIKSTITIIILAISIHLSAQETGHSLRQIVEILASDSFEGRGFRCASKTLSIEFLKHEFQQAGFEPINGSYEQKFMNFEMLTATEGTNIVGVIQGTDSALKNEYIVIGAHFDHLGWKMEDSTKVVYNGADDNASGVGTMIETGKMLLANRSQLKRSILLIAFDGEEAGLIGSTEFLKSNLINPKQIKAMYSLDMVGMYSKNEGLNTAGVNSLSSGEDLFQNALQRGSLVVKKSTNSIAKGTDTRPFGDAGIPAIHFSTGMMSPYHKPEDDADSLDYEGMSKIAVLLVDFSTILSNEEELIAGSILKSGASDDNKKSTSNFMIGYNLGIGENYHYYESTYFNGKPVLAFEGGLSSQLRLSNIFMLQADVNYEFLGSESMYGNTRMHSVVPALNLMLTTKNRNKSNAFTFASIGGYYRYNFAGSSGDSTIPLLNAYQQNEYGIKYGIGLQFEKVQFFFNSLVGLSNIDKVNANGNVFNRGNYFSFVRFF